MRNGRNGSNFENPSFIETAIRDLNAIVALFGEGLADCNRDDVKELNIETPGRENMVITFVEVYEPEDGLYSELYVNILRFLAKSAGMPIDSLLILITRAALKPADRLAEIIVGFGSTEAQNENFKQWRARRSALSKKNATNRRRRRNWQNN